VVFFPSGKQDSRGNYVTHARDGDIFGRGNRARRKKKASLPLDPLHARCPDGRGEKKGDIRPFPQFPILKRSKQGRRLPTIFTIKTSVERRRPQGGLREEEGSAQCFLIPQEKKGRVAEPHSEAQDCKAKINDAIQQKQKEIGRGRGIAVQPAGKGAKNKGGGAPIFSITAGI